MSPGPEVKAIGSSVFVVYPASESCAGITLEFARLVDHKDTLTAEVTITSLFAGELAWARVNLVSVQGRNALAKAADEVSPEAPWRPIVDQACRLVAKHVRKGQPAVPLTATAPNGHRFLVDGYLPLGQISVLYADGGSGKSLLALALAVSGILGHPLSRRWAVGPISRCLYLDWESDQQTHAERLWGLTSHREPVPEGAILYRRLWRPFTDHLDDIQGEVARHAADLVIIDSLAPAAGPEPESGDASVRTLSALGSLLPATVLVIAHVSKAHAESGGRTRIYGSVFNSNLARSTVEVSLNEGLSGDQRLAVTLTHTKNNLGPKVRPSALAFEWDTDGHISIMGTEPDQSRASLPDQVLTAMTQRGLKSATALSEDTGISPASVRQILHRLEKRDMIERESATGTGRGHETQWRVIDRKRDTPF